MLTKLNYVFLSIFLFLSPVLIDVKIMRLKLFCMEITILLMVVTFLLSFLFSESIKIKKCRLYLPIILYFILTGFYYLISGNRFVAFPQWQRALFSLGIFIVAVNIINERNLKGLLYIWFASSFLVIIYGLIQYFGLAIGDFYIPKQRPIFSTFGNPNFFSSYLVVSFPVFLGFFLQEKRKNTLLIYSLLSIAALMFTYSRGGILGFLFSIILFLIFQKERIKILKEKRFIILVVLVFLIFIYFTRNIWVKKTERLLIWKDTLVMALKNPLGVGLGAFHTSFPQYASNELLEKLPPTKFIVNYAHNEFLEVFAETGIIGLIIFLSIIWVFFKEGIEKIKSNKDFITTGLLASAGGILLQSFFSVNMRFTVSAIYFYFILGLFSSHETKAFVYPLKLPYIIKLIFSMGVIILSIVGIKSILSPLRAQRLLKEDIGFFQKRIVNPKKTIIDLENTAKEYPDNYIIFYKLGWVYAKEKNFTKAIENFNKALELKPDQAGIHNNLGNIYFLLNKKEKAILHYKKAIEIDPKHIDAHFNLGYLYYTEGRLKQASKEFKKVLELDPRHYKATLLLEKMVQ